MKWFINYADRRYLQSQIKGIESAKPYFDKVIKYSRKDIDKGFFKAHESIFICSRGAGFWLWKPYLILKTMNEMEDGDILFYSDSGAYFKSSPEYLIELCEKEDIILFQMPEYQNCMWTKRDCFHFMECDKEKYVHGPHWNGAFQIYKKTPTNIKFVEEYLYHASDWRIIMDHTKESGKPEYPEFKDHRHDQSILSLMAIKHDIKPHVDPSQFGGCDIIHHTRDSK